MRPLRSDFLQQERLLEYLQFNVAAGQGQIG